MFFNCKNIHLKKTLNTNDVSGSKWVYHIAIQLDAHCWSKNATVWVSVTNHFAHIWLVNVHSSCEVGFANITIVFHSAERVPSVQYGLILFLHTTAGFHICVKLIFAIFWCFLRSHMPIFVVTPQLLMNFSISSVLNATTRPFVLWSIDFHSYYM